MGTRVVERRGRELERLAADNAGLLLRIEADGEGFDAAAIPAGHLGAGIMRERAEAIGAALRAERSWLGYPGRARVAGVRRSR